MTIISAVKNYLFRRPAPAEKTVVAAYDLLSAAYDNQPGNLLLHFDEMIITDLLETIDLEKKVIANIGCGTGRHWQKLYSKKPAIVMGFDVSGGMLDQLKSKFKDALINLTTDNLLNTVPDKSVDCLINTLTIGYIQNIDEAIAAWARVLKKNGDLLITDFHPTMLVNGGKRSFTHNSENFSVTNYLHPLEKVKTVCCQHGFTLMSEAAKYVDQTIRHFYEEQYALPVYNQFRGMPVIYGLHLKKQHDTE